MPIFDNSSLHEQEILDARMEYQQLVGSYQLLAQLVWVSYGAYFAINTLLATALGASFSTMVSDFAGTNMQVFRLLVPVVGIATACTSVYVAFELSRLRKLNNHRGREVEKLLFARTFRDLQTHAGRAPTVSYFGSFTIAALWIAMLTVISHNPSNTKSQSQGTCAPTVTHGS